MSGWIKEIEADAVAEDATYFIARRPRTAMASHLFYAKNIKGKAIMSEKPGIADRFVGNEKLRAALRECGDLVAIEVPADADKRWKRRKRVLK
jgi:hypothetical protein